MSKPRTRLLLSPGFLAAAGIGLAAAGLTVAGGLPYGHDSALHLYRLVSWDYLFRHGLSFRWAPFLSYGYGSPLFNYYPFLLYLLTEPIQLLGFLPMTALQITLDLILVGLAAGVYTWTNDIFGPGAGLVAAAAFVFSPYTMYTLLNRASFSEITALLWMPWGLWALYRYSQGRGRGYGLVGAAAVAAILLSHLFTAYLFIATLLPVLAGLAAAVRPGERGLSCFRLAWPVGLGVGLAAFFWLPAMVERPLVQVERMLLIADPATGAGLEAAWRVFTGPLFPAAGLPVAVIPPRLSPLAAGLGLVGLVSGWRGLRSPLPRLHLGLAGLIIAGAVFMHTPASLWLWQTIPLLRLGQFPFRFLSVAGLWLALLAGAGVAALLALLSPAEIPSRRAGRGQPSRIWPAVILVTATVLAVAMYTFGWPTIAYHRPDLPTGLTGVRQFERESGAVGLQTGGEYRLQTVKAEPPAESGPSPGQPRLVETSLPAAAHLLAEDDEWLHYRLSVDSPEPFRAVFKTFYFPGWRAAVNGQAVPLAPSGPSGLISLPVPAGRQQIEVWFDTTPVRRTAAGISWLSVVVIGGSLVILRYNAWKAKN